MITVISTPRGYTISANEPITVESHAGVVYAYRGDVIDSEVPPLGDQPIWDSSEGGRNVVFDGGIETWVGPITPVESRS